VATIPVSGYPADLAVTPDGLMALVVSQNKVSAIDVPSLTLTPLSVPIGSSPVALAVTPDGSTLLVTDGDGNTVTVI
jgi:DNA-binding beta-propeller fold protein YncE